MKTITLSEVNDCLGELASVPDYAGHVDALRGLVADGKSPDEIDFLMRGMFPRELIDALVAQRASEAMPVIEG